MKRFLSAVIVFILIISGVSAHAARAGVKEGVHTGFAAAQGQKSAPQDILARFMTATFSAIAAESVGKIYAGGAVDPIIHKLLHGGIGVYLRRRSMIMDERDLPDH